VVYCYSPARWLYQPDVYLGPDAGYVGRTGLRVTTPALKRWDVRAARSADRYLAISSVVRDRIRETYGLPSEIVPAPYTGELESAEPEKIDLPHPFDSGGFLLCVSRLLPYKNVDVVLEAMWLRPNLTMVVVGRGPDRARLDAGKPPNVVMLTDLSDGQMRWLYERSVGLVAASHEDFGLTPLEAAAFGKPSALLRAGGFLDTTIEGRTGVFFDRVAPAEIATAMDQLMMLTWDQSFLRAHPETFSEARFASTVVDIVTQLTHDRVMHGGIVR
jgi:glycosyltransferase involved in cell wall biosynthesis